MYKVSALAALLSLVRTSASHSGCRGVDALLGVDSPAAAVSWAWDGHCVNVWSPPPFTDIVTLEEQASDKSWRTVDAIAIGRADGGWLCPPFRGIAAQLPLRLRFVDEDEDTACPDLFEPLLQKKRRLADAESAAPTPAPTPAPSMAPTYNYPASAAPTSGTWAPSPAPTYADTWAPTAAPTAAWLSFSPTPAPSMAVESFAPTPAPFAATFEPTAAATQIAPSPATPMPTPVQVSPPVGGSRKNRKRNLYENLYAEEEAEWIAAAAARWGPQQQQQQQLLPASWRSKGRKQAGQDRRSREE